MIARTKTGWEVSRKFVRGTEGFVPTVSRFMEAGSCRQVIHDTSGVPFRSNVGQIPRLMIYCCRSFSADVFLI